MATKFIITADLHQNIAKWRELVRVVEQTKPRFVLVAGDLLPKDGGFNGQRKFFPVLADYLGAMRGSGETTILTFFGNDDFHPLEPLLDDLAVKGLCVNLNGKVHREDGLVFCGMNFVRDYPFGYKHWCAPDGDFIACPVQFCGEGLTLDAKGSWIELPNLRDYLLANSPRRMPQQNSSSRPIRSVSARSGLSEDGGSCVAVAKIRAISCSDIRRGAFGGDSRGKPATLGMKWTS